MEPDAWARYVEVIRMIICFVVRTQDWADQDRPPYQLTRKQGDLWDALMEMAELPSAEIMTEVEQDRLDRLCLDSVVELMDHPFQQTEYESAVISALAVMGLKPDGGWELAEHYTTKYSAVIKVMRIMVIGQAVYEDREEQDELRRRMSFEDAVETSVGVIRRVRQKVYRFMVAASENTRPNPIDWIFHSLTYGMKIQTTTLAEGRVDWRGDRLTFQKIKVTVNELCDMVHGLVTEARELMSQLLFAPEAEYDGFPAIAWAELEDDHSETRDGYSFMQDDRNRWAVDGRRWLMERILGDRGLQSRWLDDDETLFREAAVKQYEKWVDEFRERLWVLMHLTGGQPARGPEILGVRYCNTGDGGVRNIFVHDGLISFVALYHKNFRSSERAKVIHRYVPREIGSLLVWYLWLVLPFWQQVQGIIRQGSETSPYLWAKQIVIPDRAEGTTGSQNQEDGGTTGMAERGEDPDPYGVWHTDRVRRRLQTYSQRLIGVEINVSSWRHIAIAIGRRYLDGMYRGHDQGTDEDSGNDSEEDEMLDLQSGHSTHMAGMMYGLLIQRGQFGTATRREKFRRLSIRWHRLLAFRGKDDSIVPAKRRREAWDREGEASRQRRFKRLCQTDIHGQLRQMMGDGAAFRGCQEQVIRAICRGISPIMQITGTGGGKSLSFMLPAFCSGVEGVTIVVVPLVALREDLQRRCRDQKIDVHVWKSRGANRAASIVLVTPESVCTKGFRAFVNRLQARQQLDRVVVDECHMVLDAVGGFRPLMQELGRTITGWGIPMVFLTATLSPRDESEFFRVTGLRAERVTMFRMRTTRRNIRYRVRDIEGQTIEEKVGEEVGQLLARYPLGKIIVYGGTIRRTEALGELLECPVYHASVAEGRGKMRILQEWIREGRVIAATNALGVGLDVADVRAVVHAGCPRKLREYAQESGRGGRDGQLSEAVIVCRVQKCREDQREGQEVREEDMVEYVEGGLCRRLVLDEVMDGYVQRVGCEEGEEVCDNCKGSGQEEEKMVAEIEGEDFERMRRETGSMAEEVKQQCREEMEAGREWVEQLEDWRGACVVCRMQEREGFRHGWEECPWREGEFWEEVIRVEEKFEEVVFGGQGLEAYSGCAGCGVPQILCDSWQSQVDDEGRFMRKGDSGWDCQYRGVVLRVIAGMWIRYPETMPEVVKRVTEEAGWQYREGDGVGLGRWMGQGIRWGGFRTNQMCRLFYRVVREWV